MTRLPSLTCGQSTAEHRAWPQCEVGETAEGVLGAPSDKELRGLSAPSRASVAPGATPPPRLSSPLAHHGRHNIVHKLISLGNGLQAGKRPTLGRPAAARQTPAGDVPLPPVRPVTAPSVGMPAGDWPTPELPAAGSQEGRVTPSHEEAPHAGHREPEISRPGTKASGGQSQAGARPTQLPTLPG